MRVAGKLRQMEPHGSEKRQLSAKNYSLLQGHHFVVSSFARLRADLEEVKTSSMDLRAAKLANMSSTTGISQNFKNLSQQ